MLKTEKVYQITVPTPFPVGDVHMYLLKGDVLTLIDAGVNTDEAWETLHYQLKELGYDVKDIEQIILTHHHPDHTGLVSRLEHVQQIYAHPLVEKWLTRDQEYFDRYFQFFEDYYQAWGVPEHFQDVLKTMKKNRHLAGEGALTGYLQEHDTLPGHEGWTVIETPGHAQSHLSFYHSYNHDLLAGDHMLYHISSNPLLEPPMDKGQPRPKPMLQYRESMQKMLSYEVNQVYPGHGPLFHKVDYLIKERINKQEKRAEKVFSFLADGPLTPFEVCQKLFPRKFESQFELTLSETMAQLDYLESTGRVKVERNGNRLTYMRVKQ
ncbi:Glyoxylase, beta-lactamase superfamily II [Salinibacillus kushneri]|uniref:Glyoxylase, beta-lactamase superfamily II n=1 Tax=Salinibacillus kushneri TaxID=237682 RepID=A0A1I0HVB7_9BACI|nr:MBL fold metallo-hydrolase [Salinibacillus kushneri]SET88170.1 Glyoxylase, beta-lactamase superfamily II [Salinibacillus kushneri]